MEEEKLPEGTAGEMSIEESLERLEQIVEQMEDRNISLEETFSLYEQGIQLVKECSGRIDRVEQKITVLAGEGSEDEF